MISLSGKDSFVIFRDPKSKKNKLSLGEWELINSKFEITKTSFICNIFNDDSYILNNPPRIIEDEIIIHQPSFFDEKNISKTEYQIGIDIVIKLCQQKIIEKCIISRIINISSISGGLPPYEILWEDFPAIDTSYIDGLTPGSYEFTIIDQYGCIFSDTILISGDNEINTNVTLSDILCSGNSDGSISIEITNDDHYPYYYSINDLNSFEDTVITNTFTIDSLPIGDYTIYIKDGDNCIDSLETITLNQPEPLLFSTTVSNVSCNGGTDGQINFTIAGGVPYYKIYNNLSSDTIYSNEGIDSLLIESGNYEFSVIDSNNCIYSQSIFVDQPDPLVLEINSISNYSGYNISCQNSNDGFIDLNVFGGTSNYELSFNDTLITINNNSQVINNLSAGIISLNLVDNNECSTILDTVLTSPENIDFDYSTTSNYNGFDISCHDSNNGVLNTTILGGVGPYDYSSNGGITFEASNIEADYSFDNLSTGSYNFLVRDINGCIDNFTYEINSPNEIIPSLVAVNMNECYGESNGILLAQVSGGVANYTYKLTSLSDTIIVNSLENTYLFEGLLAGVYELNIIDNNLCQNSLTTTSIEVITQPNEINYDFDISNLSCNSEKDGDLTIENISGGFSPYTLKVYNSVDFYYEENSLESSTTISLDSLSSGSYNVILIDQNNCNNIDTVFIDQPDVLLVYTDLTDLSCASSTDGSININVNGGTSPYNILVNQNSFTTDDSQMISNLNASEYEINIIDNLGCSFTTNVLLNEPEAINIKSSIENNVCFGENYGSASFIVNGGILPYSYLISDYSGEILSQENSYDQFFAGDYIFTIIDSNNCIKTDSFTINQPEKIIAQKDIVNESCPNLSDGSINLSIYNFQNSFDIFWQNENMFGTYNSNLTPGEYIYTIIDSTNCFIVDTAVVQESIALDYELIIENSECSYTNDAQLIIDFNQVDNFAAILTNETYTGLESGTNTVLFQNLTSGEYQLRMEYNFNCTVDTNLFIESTDGFNCITPEPTFSPNSDGINDVFSPLLSFNETGELIIFNKWGDKIFYENSFNPSWDGTDLNGNLQPSADYYFVIKFNNQTYKDITGIITLLK